MRSFSQWFAKEGCRDFRARTAQEWSQSGWEGAIKELRGEATECESADGEHFEPRGRLEDTKEEEA